MYFDYDLLVMSAILGLKYLDGKLFNHSFIKSRALPWICHVRYQHILFPTKITLASRYFPKILLKLLAIPTYVQILTVQCGYLIHRIYAASQHGSKSVSICVTCVTNLILKSCQLRYGSNEMFLIPNDSYRW